jgi:hypothetical protein
MVPDRPLVTLWERRLAIDKWRREECAKLTEHIRKEAHARLVVVQQECAELGHSFVFNSFNVGGSAVYRCNTCGFGKVEHDP